MAIKPSHLAAFAAGGLQRGKRGGTFYVTATGAKVYTDKPPGLGRLPHAHEEFGEPHKVSTTNLDDISIREGTHPRRLDRIREGHAAGKTLPPLEVDVYPEGKRTLNDGNHRLRVAREDGHTEVPVKLRRLGSENSWAFHNEARRRGILPDRPTTDAEYEAARPALLALMKERGGVR